MINATNIGSKWPMLKQKKYMYQIGEWHSQKHNGTPKGVVEAKSRQMAFAKAEK